MGKRKRRHSQASVRIARIALSQFPKRQPLSTTTMIEPDRDNQRDHWQAIADQLGISDEPAPGFRAAEAPKPVRPEPGRPRTEPAQLQHAEEAAPAQTAQPASADSELPADSDDRPRRGRRRRSGSERGPRRSPDEEGGQRRGRGRTRRPAPSEEESTEDAPAELELEVPVDDGEADEIPDMSDWDIPSWNDLIASLYRPDR